jgi:hypothetical protein
MNLKNLINIVLVYALLLCACDKENDIDVDNDINFPVTLYAYEVSRVSAIRLFVNKKEIYDSNIIRIFVGNSEYFKPPTNTDIQSSNESMYFLSKDSVLFGTLTIGFTIKKDANQFLFYSPKMVYVNGEMDMPRPLLKYTDELIPLPPTTGYNYITSEVRVGYGSYKNLEISFLSYMYLRNRDSFFQFASGRLLNEFNESAINSLQLGDTLAIQEYRVRFIDK